MKIKTIFTTIGALMLLMQCIPLAPTSSSKLTPGLPPNAKPGSCYAKCLMPDQSSTQSNYVAVYTGDENDEEVDIETREIILKPASSKWEKKKSDRNCLSADPNDCLVWCKVNIPAETKIYKVLIDTSQSQNFYMEDIKHQVLTKKGGYREWKEVICTNQVTDKVYAQIRNSLTQNGYYKEEAESSKNNSFPPELKSALIAFQKENQLPIGELDHETLDALGVIF